MNYNEIKENFEKYANLADIEPSRKDAYSDLTVRYDDEFIELSKDHNPTLGYKITELKPLNNSCQFGCGRQVCQQKADYQLVKTPVKHWRTRCLNCHKYQHPNGVDMIHQGYQVHNTFRDYFKNSLNTPEM